MDRLREFKNKIEQEKIQMEKERRATSKDPGEDKQQQSK
jgi:hypothetical protein